MPKTGIKKNVLLQLLRKHLTQGQRYTISRMLQAGDLQGVNPMP